MQRFFADLSAAALIGIARAVTGVRAIWRDSAPIDIQRVYFGNHSSHADFLLIWTSLPPRMRSHTRPVAGSDYWLKGGLRTYIATHVINAVLVDREKSTRVADPIAILVEAVDAGASLIIFPEGTRNTGEQTLLPFKSGIFHLAAQRPNLEFVPVWLENLNRVMPKGEVVPIPLLCTATFGAAIKLQPDESKESFLERARDGLLALAPVEQSD